MDADAELTDRDRAMLAFEGKRPKHTPQKESAIRDEFGFSATRYYQLLHALILTPAALKSDPVLVNRLLRATQERKTQRASRTLVARSR